MATVHNPPVARRIPSLRWWIGGILFASTVINYLDRQTLSWLSPYLKVEYHWTNTDYAMIVIAFRITYTIGQTVIGSFMDRIGTRRGLSLTVAFYSLVAIATSFARGKFSFAGFRFLLGAGESGNWPGATKAVAEWFPKQERGLATALFDSGSSLGGAIAPLIVFPIYYRWGWRPAFAVPGVLGFLWLIVWRWLYYPPETSPHISAQELAKIQADRYDSTSTESKREKLRWRQLWSLPQTWGTIIAKSFTDPVWFFVTDWFPIFLVGKGIELRQGVLAFWVPFIAADLGNFFSGFLSGELIKRGWSVEAARKAFVILGGLGVTLLIPTILTRNLYAIIALFAAATFSYACFSTMANVLPTDLFESQSVASVSGLSGTGAGIGTIIASALIGHFSDVRAAATTHAFDPIVVVAGLVPFVGMLLVLFLVRNTQATEKGQVREI